MKQDNKIILNPRSGTARHFWKTLFENDPSTIRLGNDREYMICEVNNVFILMFYGDTSPVDTFDTLNDAVKWVVNRMVETEKNTKFLTADWSKARYYDRMVENEKIKKEQIPNK